MGFLDTLIYGYRTVVDGAGTALLQRNRLKFVGASSVADDAPNAQTVVTFGSPTTLTGNPADSNYAVISASGGTKFTGNPKTVEYDVPVNATTPTTSATAIFSFATTTARAYSVRGIVRVQNSPVSAYGEFEVNAYAFNNVGTLTVVGTPVAIKVNNSGFALTLTAVGTSLVVTATDPVGARRWTGRLYIAESNF